MRPRPSSRPASLVLAALVVALLLPASATAQRDLRVPRAVSATSALVVQPDTGDVVAARDARARRPIASTTKLMTALLTLERFRDLDRRLTVLPYAAAPAESVAGLRGGERLSVRDLLRALLVASANDAAATLAVRVAGSRAAFVRAMNRRARQLGLRDTSYADPVGLSSENRSSAGDLVTLAAGLLDRPAFAAIVGEPSVTLRTGDRVRRLLNRNLLVRSVPWVTGVKTGRTNSAGYVLVASGRRDGVRVLSAVLGAPSEAARNESSLALLRLGLRRYRRVQAVRGGAVLARVGLEARDEDVPLVATRPVRVVVRRGERPRVRVLGVPEEVDGPLARGARLGTVEVRLRGRIVDRVALVTARAVPEATLAARTTSWLAQPLTLLAICLLLACSVSLALLRRRAVRGGRADRATR